MSTEALFKAALAVRNNSYSPYSGYKVACALISEDGKIYSGVNVENASYGATICAERSGVFTAISDGQKNIREYLVMTDSEDPWAPCGLCRQVMLEFSSPETKVHLANLKGVVKSFTMAELVPHSFNKEALK